jgi:hypothetical protein
MGPIGLTGPAGATGAEGPAGPAGPRGATGPTGPAGPVGATGAPGTGAAGAATPTDGNQSARGGSTAPAQPAGSAGPRSSSAAQLGGGLAGWARIDWTGAPSITAPRVVGTIGAAARSIGFVAAPSSSVTMWVDFGRDLDQCAVTDNSRPGGGTQTWIAPDSDPTLGGKAWVTGIPADAFRVEEPWRHSVHLSLYCQS